jgi:hypothetical protein
MTAVLPEVETITFLRRELFSKGYKFVPVLTGEKKTLKKGWTEDARRLTVEDAVKIDPAYQNTGILCDGLRAIDIDCDDPDTAPQVLSLALRMLGPAPVRTRSNSPRLLLVYRAENGSPKKRTETQLEVLGHGQQFVAFGGHPSGASYEWYEGSPLSVSRNQLTMVSEKQLNDFIEAYYSLTRFAPPPAKARWGNGSLVSVWSSPLDHHPVRVCGIRTDF